MSGKRGRPVGKSAKRAREEKKEKKGKVEEEEVVGEEEVAEEKKEEEEEIYEVEDIVSERGSAAKLMYEIKWKVRKKEKRKC